MFFDNKDRKVIPRWRDFETTTALGELSRPKSTPAEVEADARSLVSARYRQWQSDLTVWHAADVLSSALVIGIERNFLDVARYVVEHKREAPRSLVGLATRILNGNPRRNALELAPAERQSDNGYQNIHLLRERLSEEPRNSIAWTDLARMYCLVGQYVRAERAMRTACIISPSNRFILRAASRLFLHIKQPEVALNLLRKSPAAKNDPWLLAAEVSVSSAAKTGSYFAKHAKKVVDSANFSDFAKTELTSAVATLELENGRHRAARKLFNASLSSPNENSLAQAEWVSRQLPGVVLKDREEEVPRRFEADSHRDFYLGQWESSFRNSLKWMQDQPFSSRPALLASYLGSTILERYDETERILRLALKANPTHPILLNDLAYLLAVRGDISQAQTELARVDPSTVDASAAICLMATQGLIFLRKGAIAMGREWYSAAIQKAEQGGQSKYRALATVLLAREEVLAGSKSAGEAVSAAEKQASAMEGEPDVQLLLARVQDLYETRLRKVGAGGE